MFSQSRSSMYLLNVNLLPTSTVQLLSVSLSLSAGTLFMAQAPRIYDKGAWTLKLRSKYPEAFRVPSGLAFAKLLAGSRRSGPELDGRGLELSCLRFRVQWDRVARSGFRV